ncbi:MAG: hypothetical protein U0Q21_07385 [Dermatophilaceae bacterium]
MPEQYVPESASPVAVRAGVTTAHAVYTMSAGDVRADGSVTPANRVVLGLTDETLAALSDDGVQLVDNAILWAADPGTASLMAVVTPVGRWKLDGRVTVGSDLLYPNTYTSYGRVKGALHPGTTPADQSLTMATTTGKHVEFPGFREMKYPAGWVPPTPDCHLSLVTEACGATVDPGRSALVIASTSTNAAQASTDMNVYRPGSAAKFQVKVSIKPVDFDPGVTHLLASQSPNVVQMGRKEDPAQWKISVETDMRPRCEFTGSTPLGKKTITAEQEKSPQSVHLKPGFNYTLTCTLTRQAGSQTVKLLINSKQDLPANGKGKTEPAAYSDFIVSPTTNEIWVGHKPPRTDGSGCHGCDSPGDSFAGGIDDIWISRQD